MLLAQASFSTKASPASAGRQSAAEVAGIWQGTIDAGGTKLRVVLKVSKGTDGTLTAALDSIDQGAKDLKVDTISVKDSTFSFEMKMLGASYTGRLNNDGSEINGQFTQGGGSIPLVFRRGEKPPEPKRPQEPKPPYPYNEEEVVFENKSAGVKLAGTLTLPRAGGPFAAVLLITGSGPQDRNEMVFGHKPFMVLADHLTRSGLAVLRYDDRGIGKSTGEFGKANTEDFAGDAVAGVEYLKTRKEINPKQIGLIGHSEGGIIAPIVAVRSPDVAFVVLLAGTAMPGDQLLYLQGNLLAKAAGASDQAIADQRALQEAMFAIVRQERDSVAAERKLREHLGNSIAGLPEEQKKAALQQIEVQIKTVNSPWFRYFLTYDPVPMLKRVQCPVLALNGGRDLQVPPKENLEKIAAVLKESSNKDYKTVVFPGLNHLFQTCTTGLVSEYTTIEETISPPVLATISDWLLAHTKR
jgi:pimeloyl-ACP methyl ester carboxylesterase